jgi:hypothetical protein
LLPSEEEKDELFTCSSLSLSLDFSDATNLMASAFSYQKKILPL